MSSKYYDIKIDSKTTIKILRPAAARFRSTWRWGDDITYISVATAMRIIDKL